MATDIFSMIEGLVVEKEDLLEAELFAQQYLEDSFPTYDFRQGTALRDMTVRPNALMLALVNKALRNYYDDTDIINMDNTTSSDIVDRKMSNFFITRHSGTIANITSRLYFVFPSGNPIATSIPSSAFFSPDGDLEYFPEAPVTVLPAVNTPLAGSTYFQYDSGQSMWYVDVRMNAASPTEEYNLSEGDLLYFTVFSPYFVKAEILFLNSKSIPAETNSEMVDRAYTSVSTRNLINEPSIVSKITDTFNYIKDVYVVGLGNEYLYRDIISIESSTTPDTFVDYHRGSMVDVLVDTDPATTTLQLTTEVGGIIEIEGPVIMVERTTDTVTDVVDDIDIGTAFTMELSNGNTYDSGSVPSDPEGDTGLSSKQMTKLTFDSTGADQKVTLKITYFDNVSGVQTFIDDKKNRVVSADYLIRSFEPNFIDVTFQTHSTEPESDATKASILAELDKYIRSIDNGGTLYVSSLIDAIIESGHTDIVLPITVSSTLVTRGLDETTTPIVDSMSILPIRKFRMRNLVLETL